jgi:hypothetical protein
MWYGKQVIHETLLLEFSDYTQRQNNLYILKHVYYPAIDWFRFSQGPVF